MSEHAHEHPNYVKIWAILVALLAVSVAGPELGIPIVTLITAFGIAIVKAYLVAKHFMHLDIEKRYIVYMLTTCLVFIFLFFTAVAPDVMKYEGTNWVKTKVETAPPPDHGDGHGETHGEDHASAEHH